MSLSGKQVQHLRDALLDAYGDADELRRMVRIALEEKLEAIAGGLLPAMLRQLGRPGVATKRQEPGLTVKDAGDPIAERLGIEWVTIPAGEFTMGSNDDDDEKPIHKVNLPEYRIARHPVTNAQYQAFVKAKPYKAPSH